MSAKTVLWNGAHLAVLSAFALAQPLFNLLSDNPEFFAARGSTSFDIISFAVLLVVVPPAVLLAIEALAGLASPTARESLHLTFIGLFVSLIAVQALKDLIGASDAVLIALALVAGAAGAAAYARAEPVKSFMNVLSPAPLVFLALFLFFSPVHKLTLAGEASAKSIGGIARVPVVMVLFDELPSTSLMDERRRIDAARYPAFAELARDAVWFRNAYTIYDSTSKAIPAIMDGKLPEEGTLPTSSQHPDSIFTLLGKSHRMNVAEEATTVCPRDLCRDARLEESYGSRLGSMSEDLGLVWLHVVSPPEIEEDLPSVSETWGDFGGDQPAGGGAGPGDQPNVRDNLQGSRGRRFDAFVQSIEPSPRPALHFKHVLLPHVPWQYLPSGRIYRRTARDTIPGLSSYSFNHQGQLDQLYQRHLLQLGFTDLKLRALIRRLKDTGIYEDALIVVAADHGVAFDLGQRDRRKLTERNFHQVAPVPLLVKPPGRSKGRIDDSYVETIDILPTIADLLDVELPEKMDGVSAFSPEVRRRRSVRALTRDLSGTIRLSAAEFERRKAGQFAKQLRLFGSGSESLYRIGPHQELLGRAPVASRQSPVARAELVKAGEYGNVDPRSGYWPTHVVGRIRNGGGRFRDIAIAVNGRIAAVTRSFNLTISSEEVFAAMVPESTLRPGRNKIDVLEISAGGGLTRLGGT